MYTLLLRRIPLPAESMKSRDPEGFIIMGSMIAEWELVSQLAAHGHAEAIVFVVPRMDEGVEAVIGQFPRQQRVRVVTADRFHELHALRRVVVFSGDGLLADAAHVRAAYGDARWVVSGVTHALSGYAVVRHLALLSLQSMYPHDSLICTSVAGRIAVRHLLGAVDANLARRFGRDVRSPLQLPVIPLPAPRPEWPPMPKSLARDALGMGHERVVFLALGRFSEQMKADLRPLLLAFARARSARPDITLVLAGDNHLGEAGALEAAAAALGIADSVHIRTNLTGSVKALCYSAADVFLAISDSLQETFGVTLLEAMSAGLPVVASDWSGYRDIVRPEETGLLIPTYWADCTSSLGPTAPVTGEQESNWVAAQSVATDIDALTAAMIRLAGDADLRQRWGARGRAVVDERFSGEQIVRQYEALWEASLDASHAAAGATHDGDAWIAAEYRHFAHYASKHISADTTFRVSARGAGVLAGTMDAGALTSDRGGFAWSRMLELLSLVQLRGSGCLADLLGGEPDERDLRHVLRLAKHGLLEIAAPATATEMSAAAAPGQTGRGA